MSSLLKGSGSFLFFLDFEFPLPHFAPIDCSRNAEPVARVKRIHALFLSHLTEVKENNPRNQVLEFNLLIRFVGYIGSLLEHYDLSIRECAMLCCF